MLGVAIQFDDAPIFDLGDQAAAPDAHLAHAMDKTIAFRVDMSSCARCLRHFCGQHLSESQGPRTCRAYF
jgi:hypothetical protein